MASCGSRCWQDYDLLWAEGEMTRRCGSVSQYGHGGLMTGQKVYIMCCKLLKQDALQKAARNSESTVCVCVRLEGRKRG